MAIGPNPGPWDHAESRQTILGPRFSYSKDLKANQDGLPDLSMTRGLGKDPGLDSGARALETSN